MAESDAPLPPPTRCSLCGHLWSAHFGGGPTAVWVTCCALPGQAEPGDTPSPTDGHRQQPAPAQRAAAAVDAVAPAVAGLAGPAPTCYCRRGVEEFRQEALQEARATAGHPPPTDLHEAQADAYGARPGEHTPAREPVVLCVTCRAAPAQDTQCHPCRQARQHASRARFAARQAQLTRHARRRPGGR
ncbi:MULTISPECIES: hypothetical protein [Pseudofrankia]|uniref:hypothetical protein n=1 Tax=Pseudofrankia TaxID=2994363 RepID=UPI000234B579|nr:MULTISPECIES: hypothetical protein [Pseudofrankia]OHV35178.1 hypothetical protein BCD49_04140 [Pseudofrankia sp. EUN1h]